MAKKVLIVGAKGRFGRAALPAFIERGWQVRAFARDWEGGKPEGVETILGDAADPDVLQRAADGVDVIVNALNPPYEKWAREVPRLTTSMIAAAKASGATVMIPGNVYNYGAGMPQTLTETTPHKPTTRKGLLREEMERAYERAAGDGVRTIVVRFGDFIERKRTGNWFDAHMAAKAGEGRFMYPGPRDRAHAWAYLPDAGRVTAALAERRAEFAPFETFVFEGFNITGDELIASVERVLGRGQKVKRMPWWLLRALAPFVPAIREIVEMAYLWRVPHSIDGAKLARVLPDFRHTPLDTAIADALGVDRPREEPHLTVAHAA